MNRIPEGLDPAVQSREITFEADVTSVTPFLTLATVNRNAADHMTFGGLGSAPTPLMYFSAALAF